MQNDTTQLGATVPFVPLLRSIAREIRERNQQVANLEARSAQIGHGPARARDELTLVNSELALHIRELRRAEKELARLGWGLDPDHALRLVHRDARGGANLSWRPEDTGFYRVPASTRA